MANHDCRRSVSFQSNPLTLATRNARRNAKWVLALCTTIVFSSACLAQGQAPPQPPATPEPQSNQVPAQRPDTETIPAGTQLALVLTNPISSKTTHRGDQIQAQTVGPITVGDHVAIPAGIFVQGKVDKLRRDGSRAEMTMQSAALIFPDGYVANITGPLTVETEEGTAWLNPSGGASATAIIAPMAGLGLGALVGHAAHTTQSSTLGGNTITSSSPKGLAIGSAVGLAAGAVIAIVALTHSHQFFVEVGSPMQMTLPQPVILTENQTSDSVREAQERPVDMLIPARAELTPAK
jgi:hypothetical protein